MTPAPTLSASTQFVVGLTLLTMAVVLVVKVIYSPGQDKAVLCSPRASGDCVFQCPFRASGSYLVLHCP